MDDPVDPAAINILSAGVQEPHRSNIMRLTVRYGTV